VRAGPGDPEAAAWPRENPGFASEEKGSCFPGLGFLNARGKVPVII